MSALLSTFLLVLCAFCGVFSQSPGCDFTQNLVVGQTYYVFNKNYPNPYDRSIICRWQAVCPANTKCHLTCPNIDMPATASCSGDRLLVSVTGDAGLTGADKYCGKGSLNVYSRSNLLTVGLVSTPSSPGGIFLCTLTAEPISTPAPPCDCGWKKTTRIVGGQETLVNEFPMMVALVDVSLGIVYCGATIIHSNWVLTAAHCLSNQRLDNVGVLYGEHNLRVADSPATALGRSSAFRTHPQYSNGYDYDIGLIYVEASIPFSDRVGPACLPFKFEGASFTGAPVEVMGWGTQDFAGADSDYLQKATLNVIDQNTCVRQMGQGPTVNSRTICTYTPGKDACQHDSGGPILYQEPSSGREYIMGIVMGGYGCATSKPGLNSRVTEYLSWIQQTTGANFCKK